MTKNVSGSMMAPLREAGQRLLDLAAHPPEDAFSDDDQAVKMCAAATCWFALKAAAIFGEMEDTPFAILALEVLAYEADVVREYGQHVIDEIRDALAWHDAPTGVVA